MGTLLQLPHESTMFSTLVLWTMCPKGQTRTPLILCGDTRGLMCVTFLWVFPPPSQVVKRPLAVVIRRPRRKLCITLTFSLVMRQGDLLQILLQCF